MDRLDKLLNLVSVFEEKADGDAEGGFPFQGAVAIRTVTYYYTGLVSEVRGGFVVLDVGAWIPDTGRWSEFVGKGTVNEVEPCGTIAVNIGAIVDVVPWVHELPTKVK